MTFTTKVFSGKCPKCKGYNSRIRTEVINYAPDPKPEDGQQPIISRTRIYYCNGCQHVWSETVAE